MKEKLSGQDLAYEGRAVMYSVPIESNHAGPCSHKTLDCTNSAMGTNHWYDAPSRLHFALNTRDC